jgi:hypothetical protein
MDLTSFVYGIIFAVVIASVIVAVIGYLDGRKIKSELTNLDTFVWNEFEKVRQEIINSTNNTWTGINSRENELKSNIDSRFNKLENKLTASGAFGIIPQKKSYSEGLYSILTEDKVKDLMGITPDEIKK